MTKATSRAITLDVRSETKKGDAPKTEIQKMAAEMGRLWRIRSQIDKFMVGPTAGVETADDDRSKNIRHLKNRMAAIDTLTSDKIDALQALMRETEPRDANDAFIVLALLASEMNTSESWVQHAFNATTQAERLRVEIDADEEHRKTQRLIYGALLGLINSLGIDPVKLGLESCWPVGGPSSLDEQFDQARSLAQALGMGRPK